MMIGTVMPERPPMKLNTPPVRPSRRCGAIADTSDHVIDASDTAVLEGYLQRCLFDDTISLDEMLAAPVLGAYLASQFDRDAGVYRFHQEVDCVVLSAEQGAVRWTVAS